MKIVQTLSHSDEVSGRTDFDTGHKAYWTEGPCGTVTIIGPDNEKTQIGICRNVNEQFHSDPTLNEIMEILEEGDIGAVGRQMTRIEEMEWEVRYNGLTIAQARERTRP